MRGFRGTICKLYVGGAYMPFIILLMHIVFCVPIIQNWKRWNALHYASQYGYESLAKCLITTYQLHPSTASKV